MNYLHFRIKKSLASFHLRSDESEKRDFSVVLFRLNFGCKFGKMIFSIIFCQTVAQ